MIYHDPIPPQRCPRCNYKMDCTTGLEEAAKPKPGDFAICLNCQAVLCFDDTLHHRLVRWEEVPDEIKPLILRAVMLMKMTVPAWKAMKN
jgi:hypothetical protein